MRGEQHNTTASSVYAVAVCYKLMFVVVMGCFVDSVGVVGGGVHWKLDIRLR